MGTKRLKQVANLSGSRIQTLPGAAALLSATVRKLGASQVVISAWGLREGLLYQQLDPDVQALDPLIEAARAEGDREGRFQGQGEDRTSTRLNSSHYCAYRMPSSAYTKKKQTLLSY